jgi:hypothetical protein
MAIPTQLTGMTGVYLVAAELSRLGFIVSPTSRSAKGADLLVTDQECQKTWSVQVKTNAKPKPSWRLTEAAHVNSKSHVYVFVNLNGDERPEFKVVPSSVVAANMKGGGTLCWFKKSDAPSEGWKLFGNPGPCVDPEVRLRDRRK